ncbi:MAG: thiamine phosphate synthase [Pyrinomonadaceae bacterium]
MDSHSRVQHFRKLLSDTERVVCAVTPGNLTDTSHPSELENLLSSMEIAVESGANFVQIREKALSGRSLFNFVKSAVSRLAESNVCVALNERFDVALAAGAHGVHLTSQSLPIAEVKRTVGSSLIIGRSTHSIAEIHDSAGADYVFFGPVYSTPKKIKMGVPLGLRKLREAVNEYPRIPVVAIGGIEDSNIPEVLEAGARGYAAIRMFFSSSEGNRS